MRVPILAYHSANIAGNEYSNNDHVAFEQDLKTIAEMGLRIVPIKWVVAALLGDDSRDLSNAVGITCDDAPSYDFYDLIHPEFGPQKSLIGLLKDFKEGNASASDAHITCFAIASAQARSQIGDVCLLKSSLMTEDWWTESNRSNSFSIENHSWDHNHDCLPLGPNGLRRGDFFGISTPDKAEYEITQAQEYFALCLGSAPQLFCYPYSHVNDFLEKEWLPARGVEVGLKAAFGGEAFPVTSSSNRWNLPRFICGYHWKTPSELTSILRDSTA
jgi:Polysaccharide deacetylase